MSGPNLAETPQSGFKELQRTIGDITPKILSKELKELEMNKCITRTVENTHPVSVKYATTPYGETCMDVIMSLYDWGVKHRKRMMGRE